MTVPPADSPEQPTDPMLGRLIDGRYQVRSRIARGGMATVYLATDLRLERRVAIKVMHAHLADDTAFAQRFIQEARSAARLAHPNVVNVFDQGEDGETAYIVMEYLPGITLRDLLKDYKRLTPEQALDIMDAVLSGLAAAHHAGIVHRDLKPENVMLADDGRIKLADFGLARAASANTATGQALLGTIAYLSPELVSRGVADARSDIYALGIMLYEMLTGTQPYTGDAPMQIAYQHANNTVPPPSALLPGLPKGFDELVRWSTERDPERRPKDARVMLESLRQLEAGIRGGAQATVVMPRARVDTQETSVLPNEQTTVAFAASPAVARAVATVEHDGAASVLARHARRRTRLNRLLVAVVVVLAMLAGGLGWYVGHGPGSYLTVPDVAGSTPDAAASTLAGAGFQSVAQSEYDPDVTSGLVIGTDPAAQTRHPRDSVITIRVSLGPQMLPFPNVTGASEDVARHTLSQFKVADTSKTEFSSTIATGHVIRALDANGNTIGATYPEKGSVTLVISLGPVPGVVGLPEADADAALQKVGLNPVVTDHQFSNTVALGSVISATNASDPIAPGGNVNLVISKGQDLVPVPDVTGKRFTDAITILKAAGFAVSYGIPDSALLYAFVASTDPAKNTQAVRGSTVALKAQ